MTFHFRLMRRSVFDQVGGISGALDYVEDYDLCLRLSEVTEIRRVREPLYYYRIMLAVPRSSGGLSKCCDREGGDRSSTQTPRTG
jgi:GT2 family glycosyltransferase